MARLYGKAFAPAHISAFFEICGKCADLRMAGSRGAGVCLEKGVTTKAAIEILKGGSPRRIDVFINGKRSAAPVTKRAVLNLLGWAPEMSYNVKIESAVELPISQGFGMSAAGALSSALAVSSALKMDGGKNGSYNAVWAAHKAEIESKTGLGDVAAQTHGGFVIRETPGAPPFGKLLRIDGGEFELRELVLCIIGKKMLTKDVLANPRQAALIRRFGRNCASEILKEPSVRRMFELSIGFARGTRLISKDTMRAVDDVRSHGGMASMCMLGNSVFAIGDTDMLESVLGRHGDVFLSKIDRAGARVL